MSQSVSPSRRRPSANGEGITKKDNNELNTNDPGDSNGIDVSCFNLDKYFVFLIYLL